MIRLAFIVALACAVFGLNHFVHFLVDTAAKMHNDSAEEHIAALHKELAELDKDHRVRLEHELEALDVISKQTACEKPHRVVSISFSKTKYPHIRAHTIRAIRQGWPKVLVLNRDGTDVRRDKALAGKPHRKGYDLDEYPPAVGRRTWRANVQPVRSHENRSHGSVMGIKLRRFCDGTKFRYVWY